MAMAAAAPLRRALLLLAAFAAGACQAALQPSGAPTEGSGHAVRKVVTLIEEIKKQVEKEGNEDRAVYDKYKCWFETTMKAKEEAIDAAKKHIEELTAFVEEAAAKEGQLKTELTVIKDGLAEDQDALATATALRQTQSSEFVATEADLKESIQLLKGAVETLGTVQFAQKGQRAVAAAQAVLLQVRQKVSQHQTQFGSVMQRDLFDLLGSFDGDAGDDQTGDAATDGKQDRPNGRRQDVFLPARPRPGVLALDQEEQPTGAAAGAKSYDPKSGQIFGILSEMEAQMSKDLDEAQKADAAAETNFQSLRAAKTSEIQIAQGEIDRKEAELTALVQQAAEAKQEIEDNTAAMEADLQLVANLKVEAAKEDEGYKARFTTRSQEIAALGETLKILTDDSARELFGRSLSLLQTGASSRSGAARAARRARAREAARRRLTEVARRRSSRSLASLALHVRLDSFAEVKEAIDKMLAELQAQQKAEYEKKEACTKEIDATEDELKTTQLAKEDLAEKHKLISNTLSTLQTEIQELQADVESTKVSLKVAGEQRKTENQLFQSAVEDQRAVEAILGKALARLKNFYTLLQEPGVPDEAPPPKPQAYEKSGGAASVLAIIEKIIADAQREAEELKASEQEAQTAYASLVSDAKSSLEADDKAIQAKSAQVAEAQGQLSEVDVALLTTEQSVAQLTDLLKGYRLDCEYVLKYFDMRQQSRQEEIESVQDAKAILSGADFGK